MTSVAFPPDSWHSVTPSAWVETFGCPPWGWAPEVTKRTPIGELIAIMRRWREQVRKMEQSQ